MSEQSEAARPTRFDDLVRSERYFTATLLPAVLVHDGLRGLDAFLGLVEEAGDRRPGGSTERDREGDPLPRRNRGSTWSADKVEIITEFHIYRDLMYAGRFHRSGPEDATVAEEKERRDAPDLVIVVDDELVACEGKFFMDFNVPKLSQQLRSQRRQLKHLLAIRPEIRSYRQVALLPAAPGEQVDCDAVLTWEDVADLASRVVGPEHYVTRRLRAAVLLYDSQIREPGVRNYDGVLPLKAMLEECRTRKDAIDVGHSNGARNLQARPVDYLDKKRWKWRDRVTNRGEAIRGNWISGTRFAALVQQTITPT